VQILLLPPAGAMGGIPSPSTLGHRGQGGFRLACEIVAACGRSFSLRDAPPRFIAHWARSAPVLPRPLWTPLSPFETSKASRPCTRGCIICYLPHCNSDVYLSLLNRLANRNPSDPLPGGGNNSCHSTACRAISPTETSIRAPSARRIRVRSRKNQYAETKYSRPLWPKNTDLARAKRGWVKG